MSTTGVQLTQPTTDGGRRISREVGLCRRDLQTQGWNKCDAKPPKPIRYAVMLNRGYTLPAKKRRNFTHPMLRSFAHRLQSFIVNSHTNQECYMQRNVVVSNTIQFGIDFDIYQPFINRVRWTHYW